MKKKIIALMMGAILTMGMFTGCGESGETASTPSSTPAESTPAESAAESKAEESTAASGKVYKIACDQAYAPFSIQADDGTYYGIDVEILAAVAEIEGFEYELCPMDFSGIIPALVSGTIDGSIAGMNITEERKESVDFSDGYYESGSSLVVNKDDDSIASFEDLSGKVAACKEGTTGQLWCEDHADEYGFTVTVFPDSVSMMMAVANKQADFLIEDYPVISYQISIGEQADLKVAIEAIETAPQNGFAVKKGENAELLAMFNDGLAKIRESGKYDEIVNQYK
ncbi:MAG: transporter substrate-binding domain-containing protein [Lachnospiraceae bacterium]